MKTSIEVKVDKKKWEQVKKRLLTSSQNQLDIGFFREDQYGSDNNNLNVAAVAAWNEFGDARWSVNIPPRPFMRTGLGNYVTTTAFKKILAGELKLVFSGKRTINKVYDSIGKVLTEKVQETILELNDPPNAPSTVERKGFNDPLIDTGFMYDSVKYKIRKSRKRYRR